MTERVCLRRDVSRGPLERTDRHRPAREIDIGPFYRLYRELTRGACCCLLQGRGPREVGRRFQPAGTVVSRARPVGAATRMPLMNMLFSASTGLDWMWVLAEDEAGTK